MNLRLIVIIFSLSAILGCASAPLRSPEEMRGILEEQPQCMVKRPCIGIVVINNSSNECEITRVVRDFPADQAGIKIGDVITKFENVEIKSRYDYRRLLMQKSPGDNIQLTIRRNGQLFDKEFQTKTVAFYLDVMAISDILSREIPVTLAIVMGDINTVFAGSMAPGSLEPWKQSIKSQMISRSENQFMQAFGYDKNFSIIDRGRTESILKEFEFQQSGMVSEFRAKLGKMLGATHLLIIDFSRTGPSKPSIRYADAVTRRLIEIESGKIIASVRCTNEH